MDTLLPLPHSNYKSSVACILAADLSDPYEVLARFKAGNIEALETEMLARWGGYRTTLAQKISLIQSAIMTLKKLTGLFFTFSQFRRGVETEIAGAQIYIDVHLFDELQMFGLIKIDDTANIYSFNSSGDEFITYMHNKYIIELNPTSQS